MAVDLPAVASEMPDWLQQRSRLTPERLALHCDEGSFSFAELERLVGAIAQRLSDVGVRLETHVGVLVPNNLLNVLVIHALIRLRAVLVPFNPLLGSNEIKARVEKAKCAFLIVDSEAATERNPNASEPAEWIDRLNLRVVRSDSLDAWRAREAHDADRQPLSPSRLNLNALHSIVFTSGTTGEPKGVMLTYGNHWWNAIGSVLNLGLQEDDRWLLCLPLFHVGGLSILFRSVIYGIPVILHETFDANAVNHSIDDDGVTLISLVPTTLRRLLESRGSKPFPPSLRCVLLGGAAASPSLLEECAALSLPVCQTFGLTETASQTATLPPQSPLTKIGSSGKPLFCVELRIQNEGLVTEPGEIGEIAVHGPNVTSGYFDDPLATSQALSEGWLHTGDLGYVDPDGYLYVVGRVDDLIVSGGENVYPAEIEQVLARHASVQQAAVFAAADAEWGESVHAAVVLKENHSLSPRDLQDFCRQTLAPYKVPKTIRFVETLPRNASGKLLRRHLAP